MITNDVAVFGGPPETTAPAVATARPARLYALAIGAGLLLGVAYTLSPMLLWFAAASYGLVSVAGVGLPEDERRWIRWLLVAAIVVRVAAIALLFLFGDPDIVKTPTRVFFGDEQYSLIRSLRQRNLWLGLPMNSEMFADVYEIYGRSSYLTVIAFAQLLVGPSPYGIHLLNTLFYLAAAVILYQTSRRVYGTVPALGGLTLVLFLPSMAAWSMSALKESLFFLATLSTVVLAILVVRAPWRWKPVALAATLAGIAWTGSFRAGALQIMLAGLAVGFLGAFAMRRFWRLALTAIVLPVVLFVALRYPPVQHLAMEQLQIAARMHLGHVHTRGHAYKLLDERLYRLESPATMTPDEAVRFVARGVASFVVVPAPWEMRSRAELAYLPEQVLWYLMLVTAAIGFLIGVRRDTLGTCLFAGYAAVASVVVALNSGNVGTLVRHRAFALPYLAVLSALAVSVMLARTMSRAQRRAP
jgi:hypothetical protein